MANMADYYTRLFQLGMNSNTVIMQRMLRLMTGHPESPKELERMVREKIALSERIMHGFESEHDFDTLLVEIEEKVAQNHKRLTR
jgi:hypothetical protein